MGWARNLPYLSRLKSAVAAHQRPTAALLELPDPNSGWTSHDYRLQEAINILDREVCKSCGNPVWICHSTNNFIDFTVETGACYARAAIEEFEDEKAANPKLGPGEYHYAIPVGIDNEDGTREPLPSRKESMTQIG